jgi:hypothetical protein
MTSKQIIRKKEASYHAAAVVRGSYLSLTKSLRALGMMGVSPSFPLPPLGTQAIEGGGGASQGVGEEVDIDS